MPGILAGVDCSDHSRHALRWAMHEAVLRRVPLTVMTVDPDPIRPAIMSSWSLRSYPENSHNQDLVRVAVQELVDKVASEIGRTVPDVTVSVATGEPAAELVSASRDADMLVVGSPRPRRVRRAPHGFSEQPGHAPRGLPRRGHPGPRRPHSAQ